MCPNWDYFLPVGFTDITSDIDESHTSLDQSFVPQSKKRKSSAKEDEQTAKAQLWKALATQLSQGNSSNNHSASNLNAKQGVTQQQEDRAYIFGRTVADSLLQCDTKAWPRLKKKIMDIFFEHEEQKLTSHSFYQTLPAYNSQQQQAYTELLRNVYPSPAHQQQQINRNNIMSPTEQCSNQAFSPSNSSTHSNSSEFHSNNSEFY